MAWIALMFNTLAVLAGSVSQVDAMPMVWSYERLSSAEQRACRISSVGGDIRVEVARDRITVWVGINNQPGSLRYLRINRNMFVSSQDGFIDDEAVEIIKRLRQPGEVAFEWAAKPNYAKRQGLFGTGDFAAKLDACKTWLGGTQT